MAVNKRRVVITGLGVVSPNGVGKDEFWRACTEGRSGVGLIEDFDTSKLSSRIAAQVKNFNPTDFMSPQVAKRTDRFVHFGLASARMALEDSVLDLENEDKDRVGVVVGSVFGGVLFHETQIISGYQKGFNRVNPSSIPKVSTHAVSTHAAMEFNIKGPNLAVSTACSSGANAIGHAFRLIQNNEADIVLSGGVEAPVTAITFSAFCNLHLLSNRNTFPERACRPYDKERDGFVLGEGGAMLVLEELSHALKRNAHVYGEIAGYAANCGSYHVVMPEPDGIEAAKVMKAAIREAEIDLQEIDYVSAYGNATQPYDKAETLSIKKVFGEFAYNIPVSSIKSMIGHTVGASGAIEAVSSLSAMENNLVPPTINYGVPDPECDLDYVPNRARKVRLNNVLLNSFGVGNNNACLVMKKFMNGGVWGQI